MPNDGLYVVTLNRAMCKCVLRTEAEERAAKLMRGALSATPQARSVGVEVTVKVNESVSLQLRREREGT